MKNFIYYLIVCAVVLSIVYVLLPDTKWKYELTLVYSEEVREVSVNEAEFIKYVKMKKYNLPVYFDGEYLFEDKPMNRDYFKARIVEVNNYKPVGKELVVFPLLILVIIGMVLYGDGYFEDETEDFRKYY